MTMAWAEPSPAQGLLALPLMAGGAGVKLMAQIQWQWPLHLHMLSLKYFVLGWSFK